MRQNLTSKFGLRAESHSVLTFKLLERQNHNRDSF